MATANLFNREVRANKSPRNAFNMSYSTLFTSPCGMLLPTYVQEVKMGDKLKLGVNSLTRSSPISTPAFMSFDEKVDFWFVPYELIWSDYENWRLAQTFRYRTTQVQGVGAQNFLPYTPFSSVAGFVSSFKSTLNKVPILGATISSALRYLDLLGYSVPSNVDFSKFTNNYVIPSGGDPFSGAAIAHYNELSKHTPMNYFRLAAFQCIYMHAYRNEEYEPLDPSCYNVDLLFVTRSGLPEMKYNNATSAPTDENTCTPCYLPSFPTTNHDYLSMDKLFLPRYKNWRKDVFTSAKPTNGFAHNSSYSTTGTFGTGLEIGQGTVPSGAVSSTYGTGFYWPTTDSGRSFPSEGGHTDQDKDRYNPLNPLGLSDGSYKATREDWTYQMSNNNPANVAQALYAYVHKTSSSEVLSGLAFLYPQNIRNLMAQDKFSRAAIYADKDLSSQVKALFGENYEDEHRPLYLGSYSTNVSIDDVTSQSAGEAQIGSNSVTSILGELAGKVKSSDGKNEVFERSFNKDGIVIGVHYVMPRNNYDSYRLSKWNTKISRFDYFYPQFDGLGYQPVLAMERYIDSDNQDGSYYPTSVYGFAPRYYEYKQRTNEVHSVFQRGQSMYAWTLTNNGVEAYGLTAASVYSFKILPTITDRMFNVAWNGSMSTDPFQHYYYYDATLVSDMEVYGTPSL